MKTFLKILVVCLMFFCSSAATAQAPHRAEARQEWMKKLKALKHDFLIKELDLKEEQQREFFEVYDAKETERMAAEQRVRHAERKIRKKEGEVTDAEYDRAIAEQYKLNAEIAQIEGKYEPKFRKVLTRRQLFKLRGAEHAFQRKIMENCQPLHKTNHMKK